jgi:hypothetical protein
MMNEERDLHKMMRVGIYRRLLNQVDTVPKESSASSSSRRGRIVSDRSASKASSNESAPWTLARKAYSMCRDRAVIERALANAQHTGGTIHYPLSLLDRISK